MRKIYGNLILLAFLFAASSGFAEVRLSTSDPAYQRLRYMLVDSTRLRILAYEQSRTIKDSLEKVCNVTGSPTGSDTEEFYKAFQTYNNNVALRQMAPFYYSLKAEALGAVARQLYDACTNTLVGYYRRKNSVEAAIYTLRTIYNRRD